MSKRLILEFLDIVQLARPSLLAIDPDSTAAALDARESPFMSYDASFVPLHKADHELVTPEALRAWFTDVRPWVRRSQWEVCSALAQLIKAQKARWHTLGRRPLEAIPGLWLKPSVRGVMVGDVVAPAIVNPRRSLRAMGPDAFSFLARGGHEFHVLDEPGVDDLLVIDLHNGKRGEPRIVRSAYASDLAMMTLEQFELILNRFFEALTLSKWDVAVPRDIPVRDLFRKR